MRAAVAPWLGNGDLGKTHGRAYQGAAAEGFETASREIAVR